MFPLTDKLFKKLGSAQQDDFQSRAATYLRAAFPAETKPHTDATMAAFIHAGVKSAAGYQVRCERDVYGYLELCVLFGPSFDTSEQAPWAAPILAETAMGSGARLDLLFAAAVWSLRSKRNKIIAPIDLRASAVQIASDALWRARLYLKERRLSLGALDAADREDWAKAFESALNDVEPTVLPRAEAPWKSTDPECPSSEQTVGSAVAKPKTDYFKQFDHVCWREITSAVAKDKKCMDAMDRFLADELADPGDAAVGDASAWATISKARGAKDRALPTPDVRIANATVEAIRAAAPPWIRETTATSRTKPAQQSATLVTMKKNDEQWVFDWYFTLNSHKPRLLPHKNWQKGQ